MAVTITAAIDAPNYAVNLDIGGLTVGQTYELQRKPSGGGWSALRTWKATGSTERWADIAVAFNVSVKYRIGTVESGWVSLSYAAAALPDVPMFDPNQGQWPVLRVVNDPTIPAVRLPVSDYSADFGYRTEVMPILGSPSPVVASDVMQMKQADLVLLTPDIATRQGLIKALQPGKVMHLRAPCVDGLGDLYFRTLDVSESVPLRARPLLRAWQIELQQVARPSGYGLIEWNSGRTWGDVKTQDVTWAGVKARGTWKDVRDFGMSRHRRRRAPTPTRGSGSRVVDVDKCAERPVACRHGGGVYVAAVR